MTTYVVAPMRFTHRSRTMIDFFTVVGLRPAITRDGRWAELAGRSGKVAVHALADATQVSDTTTSLCFQVEDVADTVGHLTAQGFEARWWDEAYGRQGSVTGPYGPFTLTAAMRDTYGYEAHEPDVPSVVDVVGIIYAPDLDVATEFFAHLGFQPGVGEAPGWRPLRAPAGAGILGAHSASEPRLDGSGWTATGISFETLEPLEALADRLRDAGHPVTDRIDDVVAPRLDVTDPDGVMVEIHRGYVDGS